MMMTVCFSVWSHETKTTGNGSYSNRLLQSGVLLSEKALLHLVLVVEALLLVPQQMRQRLRQSPVMLLRLSTPRTALV